jgi:trehalose 6-phosphate phosphatase
MRPAPLIAADRCGLFLNIDGTLVEPADTRDAVVVSESLKMLLNALCLRLQGALALVSGRELRDVDRLFVPLRFCAVGIHGCQIREANGCVVTAHIDTHLLTAARRSLGEFVWKHPGVELEDKVCALALHFRSHPELGKLAHAAISRVAAQLAPAFVVEAGKGSYELRLGVFTTGSAVATLMSATPFHGRTPVYVGDDQSDEDGFRVVNQLGGISIRVGLVSHTNARYFLPDVAAVSKWLHSVGSSDIAHSAT